MTINSARRIVYTCSDGKEFTEEQKARDHEFNITCTVGSMTLNIKDLREWLVKNRNFVLDYIGTQRDPVDGSDYEPDKTVRPPNVDFVKGG